MKSDSETPHAVVTGGAGFVGSHLVDALLEDGYRVTTLDNYGSGRPENLAHLQGNDQIAVQEHDIRDAFPEFDRVDQLYHFASRASPADFKSHAVEIALTNSEGTNRVFECALKHDARIVLASTSEIYGDPEVHPQDEDYNGNVNPRGPRAPYDESKRFAEALAVAYKQQYNIDVRTARIFNTYGPRMRPDDGRAIPNFVSQALRGDDLTVYGDGTQTRSFCYVSDLVRGIRELAEASDAEGEVVNLGNTNEITVNALAETILEMIDTESDLAYLELPKDDPQVRRPDISKAKARLGWSPEVKLKNGLDQTIDYFRELLLEDREVS